MHRLNIAGGENIRFVAIAIIPLGVHPWTIFTTDQEGAFYSWLTFSLAAFVLTALALGCLAVVRGWQRAADE